jgi:hypothetical protein
MGNLMRNPSRVAAPELRESALGSIAAISALAGRAWVGYRASPQPTRDREP